MKNGQKALPRQVVRQDLQDFYEMDVRLSASNLQRAREMNSAFFAGVDPRKHREMADAGIIREDRNAMANLPRQAIHHEYPQFGYDTGPFIDDSMKE
jgi:hypothetical protein